eukprot:521319-Rhodomonas_salina.1
MEERGEDRKQRRDARSQSRPSLPAALVPEWYPSPRKARRSLVVGNREADFFVGRQRYFCTVRAGR